MASSLSHTSRELSRAPESPAEPDIIPSIPRFRYSPLVDPSNEIRLVTLHPALDDGYDIICTLQSVSLDNVGEFEALSYVWGSPGRKLSILLENQEFEVTQNLAHALRHLRPARSNKFEARTLWIDAICIDQQNIDERNHQVRRMDVIYKRAKQVVVWLGNYSEPEDELVEFPREWGFQKLEPGSFESIQEAFKLARDLARSYDFESDKFDLSVYPSNNFRTWGYLCQLFCRSWYRRLWVFQEVNLARQALILCGECTIDWNELLRAARAMYASIGSTVSSIRNQQIRRSGLLLDSAKKGFNLHPTKREIGNLMVLMRKTNTSDCEDPRDKLIGLLGVMPEADRDDIEADYSKSVDQVYNNWAWKRITRRERLDVLSACEDSGRKGLPSWVPDFRSSWASDEPLFSNTHNIYLPQYSSPYAASGDTPTRILWTSEDRRRISVTGYEIDRVAVISDTASLLRVSWNQERDGPFTQFIIQRWEQMISEAAGILPTPKSSIYKEFTDVLFRGQKTVGSDDSPSFHERYTVWRGHNPPPKGWGLDLSPEERYLAFIGSFEHKIVKRVINSQMFITSKGVIGAVAEKCHVEVGDSVYVLLGGNTPFIMRRLLADEYYDNEKEFPKYAWGPVRLRDEDGSRLQTLDERCRMPYRLMGPCYLHGWMDGEAISAWRQDELEFSLVTLC
ncbi:hypothetical protein G7Y89_g4686 [Cudoniella acicularis]|uniref:Heterokaryon incompatibility domain-containing protein n=1 Tax=Cudoniella acicularis TaxID=354080 RepID=A0A8H4W771_9HELO|nr:hypothetical protein G7Y89_g4686 [Cudoniella acicularis]